MILPEIASEDKGHHETSSRVGSTITSYSGDSGFKSPPGDRLP
jgi:hypothetical protein